LRSGPDRERGQARGRGRAPSSHSRRRELERAIEAELVDPMGRAAANRAWLERHEDMRRRMNRLLAFCEGLVRPARSAR
jgi:hypothetical protein